MSLPPYKLQESVIKHIADVVNRSEGQIKFLIELCGNDYEKYFKLEEKIREKHIFYCPNSIETVNKLLST